MKDYQEIIDKAIKTKKSYDIPCPTFEHRLICITSLLKNSGKESIIRILSDEHYEYGYIYYKKFWNPNKYKLLENYIKERKGNLEIILFDLEDHVLNNLIEKYPSQIKGHIAKKDLREKRDKLPHFIVSDKNSYVYQVPEEQQKIKVISTFVNFGDKKGAKEIIKFFEDVKKKMCIEYEKRNLLKILIQ
jgi:hypothetical protein